jgi:hypothetical protein
MVNGNEAAVVPETLLRTFNPVPGGTENPGCSIVHGPLSGAIAVGPVSVSSKPAPQTCVITSFSSAAVAYRLTVGQV